MSSMQKLLSPVGAGDIAHALRPGPLRVYFEEPVTYRGRSMPRAIAVKLASVEEGWAAVHVVMQARGYVDIIPEGDCEVLPPALHLQLGHEPSLLLILDHVRI